LPPKFSTIDAFIGVHAQDKPFTVLPPSLHLTQEVLPKTHARTGVIFQSVYQMSSMLLIYGAGVLLFICTGRISADDPSNYPIFSDEPHICPATQAKIIAT
jgi:hypothetical protein